MERNFTVPAAHGNLFIKKYIPPNKKIAKYMYGNRDKTFHILEGPVRAGKTTDNRIMFCQELDKSPEILHFAVGKTQPTARRILWEGSGLGIAHYPDWQARVVRKNGKVYRKRQRVFKAQYQGRDALAVLPKQGSGHPIKYIVAFGADTATAHEAYTGDDVGSVIATQWELLHPNTRGELLRRTIASRHRKIFIDLNPISPNATIYKEFDKWIANGDVNYMLKLMEDNPILTKERIESIKKEYDPNSIEYKRNILGQRVAAEGSIYTVRDYNIIDGFSVDNYRKYVIVADIGQESSATVFVLLGLTNDYKHVDVLMEYYHKNKGLSGLGVKMPIDYAKDYQDFINQAASIIGYVPREIISDIDLTFVREFERTKHDANLGAVYLNYKFKKGEIHDRIKEGINLLYTGRLRFNKECVNTIDAFRTAGYDEKQKDRGKYVRYDNPSEGTKIDPIDAVEYGISRLRADLGRYKGV